MYLSLFYALLSSTSSTSSTNGFFFHLIWDNCGCSLSLLLLGLLSSFSLHRAVRKMVLILMTSASFIGSPVLDFLPNISLELIKGKFSDFYYFVRNLNIVIFDCVRRGDFCQFATCYFVIQQSLVLLLTPDTDKLFCN